MDKYSGKKLDGRYEIHELIGVGGMAMVYRAYDTIDDRMVAIKILKDEFAKSEEFRRRFINESKAIAVLSHENIVKVYDVSFGDMIQYIVMEYIDGITLKEYIERNANIEHNKSLKFIKQILEALSHAHSKGIIHRDIKPQNIMILSDDTIKVADFGIARFSSAETRTMTGNAMGSVHYIAPEQAKGSVTDSSTDIYSVGVILYELLTSRVPFDAENPVSIAIMQLQSKPKMPREINPNIPRGLEEITIQAMQKDIEYRYKSAKEMLKDIIMFENDNNIIFGYEYILPKSKIENKEAIYSFVENKKENTQQLSHEDKLQNRAEKRKSPATNVIVGVVISFAVVAIVCVCISLFMAFQGDVEVPVQVPNLIGKNISEVKDNPEYKFVWNIENTYDETKAIGEIIDQDPTPSNKTIREGSIITLVVNSQSTLVSVPYINREPEESAKLKIEQKNLKANVIYVESDDVAVGMVVDTSPKAGVEVAVGSEVIIYVSSQVPPEEEMIKVPNVVGMSLEDARQQLVDAGFQIDYVYDELVDKDPETVIAQSPLQETHMVKGSTIKLTVAKGLVKETTVSIFVDLPADELNEVLLRVTIDGIVEETHSKTLIPAYNPTYTIEVTGMGEKNIVVDLDGKIYREYHINFETQEVTTTTHPYNSQHTEPSTDTGTEDTTDGYGTEDPTDEGDSWWPF